MMQPEMIFFDAAGTLLTVAEGVGSSYSRIAAEHGVHAEPALVKEGFYKAWKALPDPLHPPGKPPADDDRSWWRGLVDYVFHHALGFAPEQERMDAAFDALYAHFAKPEAWMLYDDTLPALERLQDRVRMLVLSNFDLRLPPLLGAFGLSRFFETCIISSQVGASKPHERMFEAALQYAELAPELCLHVGDDELADVQGSTAVGIPCWHVKRPGASLVDLADALGM
jgi:putative hydrolase of the HAD superfamily